MFDMLEHIIALTSRNAPSPNARIIIDLTSRRSFLRTAPSNTTPILVHNLLTLRNQPQCQTVLVLDLGIQTALDVRARGLVLERTLGNPTPLPLEIARHARFDQTAVRFLPLHLAVQSRFDLLDGRERIRVGYGAQLLQVDACATRGHPGAVIDGEFQRARSQDGGMLVGGSARGEGRGVRVPSVGIGEDCKRIATRGGGADVREQELIDQKAGMGDRLRVQFLLLVCCIQLLFQFFDLPFARSSDGS
mmetsp:Transcript_2062/g.4863  ORF Transcript_2062/g.4863 Transcript_2062/m.4863 type:complete len:248 (-) Transcript_2062:141-884(-)